MLILIWGFILGLVLAVVFLIWMQFKHSRIVRTEIEHEQLEQKVVHLEENLKKTLEIMQDLAKKMHTQQEVLDVTVSRLTQVEQQNVELVTLLSQVAKHSNTK